MKNKIYAFLPVILWTAVVAYSLFWNIRTVEENTVQIVNSIGRSFFSEIETTRLWNARHGGVYVPVTEKTQPNPYLKAPNRDIVSTEGLRMTKINPAFMTRQIAEIAKEESNIQYHITSLNPIRPANKADEWETKALTGFEAGKKEVLELLQTEQIYKYMAPLLVKQACLPCHAEQGYKLDEIRGGISVTIPAETYMNAAEKAKRSLTVIHIIALFAGIGVFYLFKSFRDRQIKVLNQKNSELEYEIKEREKVEQSLIEAKIAADAANRAKSDFLSNMSHELRTPLNAIIGFSQLLYRGDNFDTVQRENLAVIRRSGEHLLNLINNVLDMSKIEAGRLTLNEQNFDLYALLHDVEDMCRLRAEQKHLQLLFEHTPDVPQYLRTDELRLRQVLINLLNNAIKFTAEGGISVRVGARGFEEKDDSLTVNLIFEVEDTGPGISPDEVKTLFDAFVQTASGKNSQEGTGLGLTISRKFVRMMGGDMTVSSAPGKGSLFKFDIAAPMADGAEVRSAQTSRRVIALAPDQPRWRILIVDDRETNRRLLVQLLNPLGFELREAENGKQAVEMWKSWEPHLIWMDMRMQVMDGYEATKRIKAETKGQATAVIALTASTFEEEQVVVVSAGCNDFLRKPFKEIEIFDMMAKHLGVRYIYEDNAEKTEAQKPDEDVLTPAALRALPSDILKNLERSLEIVNTDLIAETLAAVRLHNAPLADALKQSVDNFDYDSILALIK